MNVIRSVLARLQLLWGAARMKIAALSVRHDRFDIGVVTLSLYLLLCAWFLSLAVTQDALYGAARPLHLEVSPRLFLGAVVVSLVFVAGAFFAAQQKRSTPALAIASLPLLLLASGLYLAALREGSNRPIEIGYVPNPRPVDTARFVIPVLFANGESSLSKIEQARLRDAIEIFRACRTPEAIVYGFASSVPFRKERTIGDVVCDSRKCRNNLLANNRAIAVSAFLAKELQIMVPPHRWHQWDDMAGGMLRDEENGQRLPHFERLNRRAELSWIEGPCEQSRYPALADPLLTTTLSLPE